MAAKIVVVLLVLICFLVSSILSYRDGYKAGRESGYEMCKLIIEATKEFIENEFREAKKEVEDATRTDEGDLRE